MYSMILPATALAAVVILLVLLYASGVVRYVGQHRSGRRREAVEPDRLDRRRPDRARRRGGLPARRAARRLPVLRAVPVPHPPRTAGHDSTGPDRLRLRARWASAQPDADACQQRGRARLPRRPRIPGRGWPERSAARDPARGHLCHQPGAVRHHHPRADLRSQDGRRGWSPVLQHGQRHQRARRLRLGRDQGCRRHDRHRHGP